MFKKEDIKPGMVVEIKFDYNGSICGRSLYFPPT